MAWGTGFDWLDGTVRLPDPMPSIWKGEIRDFYENPNDERWGPSLSRVMYHESVHFWQLVSSGYLANLVQAEWIRVKHFKDSGVWVPSGEDVANFRRRLDGYPFSALELAECWARYWDVHTREPGRLLQEDGINASALPSGPGGGYSDLQFDKFMRTGRDSSVYAQPYLWALERTGGRSRLLNLVFPVVAFSAFGSPDPVALFVAALERCVSSKAIVQAECDMTGSINVDWLTSYRLIMKEAVTPSARAFGMPDFTGGWDVMTRGRLREHPIYRTFPGRLDLAMQSLQLVRPLPTGNRHFDWLNNNAIQYAVESPLIVLMLPGQPIYRAYLGLHLPPPRIVFSNAVWYAETQFAAEAIAKLGEIAGPSNLRESAAVRLDAYYDELDQLMLRFREAEYLGIHNVAPAE